MASPWISALVALFFWWFFTGAILIAVRHADRAGQRAPLFCTFAALPILGLGAWGFLASMNTLSTPAVYIAFLSALAIWGWAELAFLTGIVTGPNPHPCPSHLPEWERFIRAWGTVAYHEMLLAVLLIAIWLVEDGAANPFASLTFTTLYVARISAKLNLYFGVPRINTEFLPRALGHLSSHFRISRLNWLFPISVTGLTAATAVWIHKAATGATPAEVAGYALIAALTALALVEHWLMVLPLPDEKLWRWMLPAPATNDPSTKTEQIHGL